MIPLDDFIKMMVCFKSSHERYNFVITTFIHIDGGLKTDHIIDEIIPNIANNHYKKKLVDSFRLYFSDDVDNVIRLLDKFENVKYRFRVLNLLRKNLNNLPGEKAYQIIQKFEQEDKYLLGAIKLFPNCFYQNDMDVYMAKANEDSTKLQIMKFIHDSIKLDEISISYVLAFVKLMKTDEYKLEVVRFYKEWIRAEYVTDVINMVQREEIKFEMIKSIPSLLNKESNPYVFLFQFSENEIIRALLYWIQNKVKPNNEVECLHLIADDQDKVHFLKMMTNAYRTCSSVDNLLKNFTNDTFRLEALKILLPNIKDYDSSLVRCLKYFTNHTFAYFVFEIFLSYPIKSEDMVHIIKVFPPNYRLRVLEDFASRNNIGIHLVQLLRELESVNLANQFLTDHACPNIPHLLIEAGYDPTELTAQTKITKQDEEDAQILREVEKERLESVEKFKKKFTINDSVKIDSNGVMEVHLDLLNVNNVVRQYALSCFPNKIIKYSKKEKSFVSDHYKAYNGVIINGINLNLELNRCLEQYLKQVIEKREEQVVKISQLKTPFELVDTKSTDSKDECVVCNHFQKRIVLNCGHFQMCARCTRLIILDKCECPTCRKPIDRATQVFG